MPRAGTKTQAKRPKPDATAATKRLRTLVARRPGLGDLEQRELDLIGLGLVALGVFAGYVLYFSQHGGELGDGMNRGLTSLFGLVAYAFPIALVAIGALLALRPYLRVGRSAIAGASLLLMAAFLLLSAGVVGSKRPRSPFDAGYMTDHGGVVGEGLFVVSSTLVSFAGTIVLIAFLVLAGVLLISGTSLVDGARRAGGAIRLIGRRARIPQRGAGTGDGDDVARSDPTGADSSVGFDSATGILPGIGSDLETAVLVDRVVEPPGGPLAEFDEARAVERERDDGIRLGGDFGSVGERETEDRGLGSAPADAKGRHGTADQREEEGADADLTPMGNVRGGVTVGTGRRYVVPGSRLLARSASVGEADEGERRRVAEQLVEALGHFGVEARVVGMVRGPSVTRYELRLSPGTKVSKVAQLKDDLAYALASTEIRILAPIPGKQAVGVEVPNLARRMVRLGDIFGSPPEECSPLTVWLGKDINGRPVWTDLARMPHLLIAGTTGSGKSGAINAMICSILLRATPDQVRLALVDPKRVELSHYDSVPHLLTPVVSQPRMAANVLEHLVREMEARYEVMQAERSRHLVELNRRRVRRGDLPLPFILCVIDELADLMMVAAAEVEDAIIRLAQKSRAVGIHLLLATQRPSTDVITGTIKVNVPARIAFAVSSQVDSRVILDQGGAEDLLGQGDMLFRPVGSSRLTRIQGAYVGEEEILELVTGWNRQGEPDLRDDMLADAAPAGGRDPDDGLDPDRDPLLKEAIALVVEQGTASVSILQRRLRVGYTRAGRLVDMLERRGIISGYEGSKPREVLVSRSQLAKVLTDFDSLDPGDSDRGSGADLTEQQVDP